MDELAIKIEGVKKQYRLGTIGGGTLTADLQSWWARKRGKEDPNSLIGQKGGNYGETFWALNGVDFEIKKGEAVGIIGHNGAGKSTLLKILSRVTAPTEGTVKMRGRVSSMLEVGTGFHPELTGRENIYLNGAILGMNRREIESKIDEIIEFSECSQFIDTPVKRYSSGMYVRLAFAVAAHLDAEILIMDEVLAVGDAKFQNKCLGKMGDAAEKHGKTVLYVSHNMNTIRQLCTRCVVLEEGKVIHDGDVDRAIELYLGRDSNGLPTHYELGDVHRQYGEHGHEIHVNKFEFLDKQTAVYNDGEHIRFKISWVAKANIENLQIYMPIRYADATPVGLAKSEPFGNAIKGEEQEFSFDLDVSNLVEGKYYFYFDIFTMNQMGKRVSYDHPEVNIAFEIVEVNHVDIQWYRQYWGSIRLNQIMPINQL